MSRKHLVEYFDTVCKQYEEFVSEIKDFEKCVEDGIVAPETIQNIEVMLEPLKNNWMTLSHVMYLLNLPNKKEKQEKYHKQNKKKLDNCKTREQVIVENDQCLSSMREFKQDVRSKI